MKKDIALFFYYSSPSLPDNCYLGIPGDLLIRNMFLLPCGDKRIHFEFPVFEDHSYSTICNLKGVRSLVGRSSDRERYIIFRTRDRDSDECNIVGYYKVGRAYYQRTSMFNNNGFVWGIEAGESHLVGRGAIVFEEYVGRNYRLSWRSDEWNSTLNDLLLRIQEEDNMSDEYRSVTGRLIKLFKNEEKMLKWKAHCVDCESSSECPVFRHFHRYRIDHPDSDMYSVIHNIYKSNVYSRNVLGDLPKKYLK